MMPVSRLAPLLLLVLLALGARSARGELEDDAWRAANKDARHLMKEPGRLAEKEKTIALVAADDSERAAKVLVKWATTSIRLRDRELRKELDEAQEKYDKLLKILLKAYDTMPPGRKEDKDNYDIVKAALDLARADFAAEGEVHRLLGRAFERLRSPEAVAVLLGQGEKQVARTKGEGMPTVVMGILACYVQQPVERVSARLLDYARDGALPEGRIRALNWIASSKVEGGFDAAVACLAAHEDAVVRSAVFTLQVLNDVRCVKPLIDRLKGADGLLQEELERTLHYFTGQSFDGDHGVWSTWWEKEGTSWFQRDDGERYPTKPDTKIEKGGTTTFYGVETHSHRIVFVLDRSGSMRAGMNATGGGQPPPRESTDEKSKMQLAREQLKASIESLPKGVRFNVIFFSTDVQVWKDPPELVPATPENRQAAIDWFMGIPAEGYTRTFDALDKALAYAAGKSGADTIFLLSDGSPTAVDAGEPLEGEALEKEYAAFLEQNRIYKCVVHTIGVGRTQNRVLLERIAHDTGGVYRNAERK